MMNLSLPLLTMRTYFRGRGSDGCIFAAPAAACALTAPSAAACSFGRLLQQPLAGVAGGGFPATAGLDSATGFAGFVTLACLSPLCSVQQAATLLFPGQGLPVRQFFCRYQWLPRDPGAKGFSFCIVAGCCFSAASGPSFVAALESSQSQVRRMGWYRRVSAGVAL